MPETTRPLSNNDSGRGALQEMPLMQHLKELRIRLFYILGGIAFGTFGAYYYSLEILNLLNAPYYQYFPPNSLIGTAPGEAFILKLKVSCFASLILTSPWIFYQVWLFISPALYPSERKMSGPFIIITSLLFSLGAWLCYVWVLPITFKFFFEQYQSISITPQIKVSECLSLSLQALFGFGVIFEAPALAYFLARFNIITHRTLIKYLRHAIVVIFIVAAVLTPTPDVVTQLLFAAPLFGLYAVSILVAKLASPSAPLEPKPGE